MSKPFFTGDELWSGPKRPIPGDSDSWDALAEYCNSKVAPLLEENSRLNAQVRTLGEQVEDAKYTIARLREENEILIATLRVIDRAEPTSDIFDHNHPHSPRVLLKENEKLRAAIEIARDALLKLIRSYKRRLKGEK